MPQGADDVGGRRELVAVLENGDPPGRDGTGAVSGADETTSDRPVGVGVATQIDDVAQDRFERPGIGESSNGKGQGRTYPDPP